MKITVFVKTNAKENKVIQENDLRKVYVNAPAKKGKANEKMIELISEHYDWPKSQISIVKGHSSKNKIVELLGY